MIHRKLDFITVNDEKFNEAIVDEEDNEIVFLCLKNLK